MVSYRALDQVGTVFGSKDFLDAVLVKCDSPRCQVEDAANFSCPPSALKSRRLSVFVLFRFENPQGARS
jgi:hypothetical protein